MQVRYIGTGEAFDHRRTNTSILVEGPERILLDCGYSVPHALWAQSLDPDWLDGVYISHFHADHCFGLPAVMARMNQDGRTRRLRLLTGVGGSAQSKHVLKLGYPSLLDRLKYPVEYQEIAPGSPLSVGQLTLHTARSHHSIPNHSIRIDDGAVSIAYSGDGAPSADTEAMYAGVNLLIHETYYADYSSKSHAGLLDVKAMALRVGVKALHVLHLSREIETPNDVHTPRPGDVMVVESGA